MFFKRHIKIVFLYTGIYGSYFFLQAYELNMLVRFRYNWTTQKFENPYHSNILEKLPSKQEDMKRDLIYKHGHDLYFLNRDGILKSYSLFKGGYFPGISCAITNEPYAINVYVHKDGKKTAVYRDPKGYIHTHTINEENILSDREDTSDFQDCTKNPPIRVIHTLCVYNNTDLRNPTIEAIHPDNIYDRFRYELLKGLESNILSSQSSEFPSKTQAELPPEQFLTLEEIYAFYLSQNEIDLRNKIKNEFLKDQKDLYTRYITQNETYLRGRIENEWQTAQKDLLNLRIINNTQTHFFNFKKKHITLAAIATAILYKSKKIKEHFVQKKEQQSKLLPQNK